MTEHSSGKNQIAWINGTLATMNPAIDNEYGLLEDHALITEDEHIVNIRPQSGMKVSEFGEIVDLKGALVTPGFIDCHTHLVFGGDRAGEWEERLNGVAYADIAARGGGINHTVRSTREADLETLFERARKRLEPMMGEGVTTVEVKSGYGLDLENERKLLTVARALADNYPVDISPTLLAAHSVPPEFTGRADDYMKEICLRIMPELWSEDLFETVDIFSENIAFNHAQTETLFRAADELGIPVKAHAEQMSNIGASALVARHHGRSVDHIEHLDEESIKALKESGTVAALLPMAFYFLKDAKVPPVALLRQYGVPMAVATDYNPGTSPFTSIRQAMSMACTLFGLTPAEALAGVTRHAARALGREKHQGQLRTGFQANFAVWDVRRPVEIFYELGYNPLIDRVFNGQPAV